MRHILVWENGVELGIWHSHCQIGQVIETNRGTVQVVSMETIHNVNYYTVEKMGR